VLHLREPWSPDEASLQTVTALVEILPEASIHFAK